jgi:hypothetical protein
LGKADNIPLKFNNLKAFYKKAAKDHFLDKYTRIDLQYNNQVVCHRAQTAIEQANE